MKKKSLFFITEVTNIYWKYAFNKLYRAVSCQMYTNGSLKMKKKTKNRTLIWKYMIIYFLW